ncbi:MAG: RecQ family ATP-dependent DNA helicase [Novosphingobium sp.]|nr:RecQ family ATP-dependent DNA helicase [Novosphingobium sp.]
MVHAVHEARESLQRVFGFADFRGVQEQVVDRVLAGESTLAVMPTGAGKSLCYQLPAVMLAGTCVVVSPLIALMHDQLRAARVNGIRAATLTSADADREETIERFRAGALDLLYVAPERASQPHFRELLGTAPLSLFAIDEAHCVSEWGHDFRPDYRLLRPLMDAFAHVPRLALTATADVHTRADILTQLGIPGEGMIVAGFDRPNIRYTIRHRDNAARQLRQVLLEQPGPGIVYAPTPDVRFVAHAGLPKSIEAYYQETGRAGRDGDDAVAVMLWAAKDFTLARSRIEEVEEARRAGERARLDALNVLVETPGCRRAILLRHFGEDPPESCGNCDNCLSAPGVRDASELARKLLSAAYRTGQSFGFGHLEKVLTGASDERVLQRGHDRLSVFGIVAADEAPLLRPLARALQARGSLVATEHGGLALGGDARAILKGEAPVMLAIATRPERSRKRDRAAANPVGDPLFDALRALRRELAAESQVPPYVIFHDAVLREMAAHRPASRAELARIGGVGARKLEAYGDAFLAVVRRHS